ncbi:hypothetical protein EFO10_02835 [Lactococcus cremoris]|nr:hypothetical protein [Lactococcus cremoris]
MAILRILEPTVTGILTIKILKSMLKEQLEQLVKMVLLQKLVIMATGGLVLMILAISIRRNWGYRSNWTYRCSW